MVQVSSTLRRPGPPTRGVTLPARATGLATKSTAGTALGFGIFLVVTATLFVRPAEFIPELLGLQIYQALIIGCLAVSLVPVLRQLDPTFLRYRPVTCCVLGLLGAILVSHLGHGRLEQAGAGGWEFAKVALYYLLLVGLVTTPWRLRMFLYFFTLCATLLACIALLQYHEVINLDTLKHLRDRHTDPTTGVTTIFVRLGGTGIFKDPNDMCLVLVLAMPFCLYWLTDPRGGPLRYAWAGPLLLLGYTLFLTKSRGGFLAFVTGVLVFLWARYGTKKAIGLAALALPVLLVLFGGRQVDLSSRENTGMQRIQLWSDALQDFRAAPLFGVGYNQFQESAGLVAHNSYLQCFADLGVIGGMLFLGAFFLVLARLTLLNRADLRVLHPEMHRLRPYLFAATAGYAAAMLTLTNCYTVPTYMVLGISVVYFDLAPSRPALPPLRLGMNLAKTLAMVSVLFLVAAYVFVRLLVRW